MKKNIFVYLIISVVLLSTSFYPAYSYPHSGEVNSKICSATTKVCVSNVTNKLTAKDEELLQACKDCCTITPTISGAKGCIPRCQKKCEKAYKKEIAKINKNKP